MAKLVIKLINERARHREQRSRDQRAMKMVFSPTTVFPSRNESSPPAI